MSILPHLPIRSQEDNTANWEQLLALLSPSWSIPELENSWSAYQPVGYLKDLCGFVHLQGRVLGGGNGTSVFSLPPKYRPASTKTFPLAAFNGVTPITANAVIDQSGVVTIYLAGEITDVGLNSITFFAEE